MTQLTEVLKLLSSNTTILLLPPAPGGVPAAVMAMPLAQMPRHLMGLDHHKGGGRALLSWRRRISMATWAQFPLC
jgi:hypothetical protein